MLSLPVMWYATGMLVLGTTMGDDIVLVVVVLYSFNGSVLCPLAVLLTCLCVHLSIVTLLTKDTCTPNPLCTPLHSRQKKIPNAGDAHDGFGALQSIHCLFSCLACISGSFGR
jgi:hypothetical protein